jgi:hypothetical protein
MLPSDENAVIVTCRFITLDLMHMFFFHFVLITILRAFTKIYSIILLLELVS